MSICDYNINLYVLYYYQYLICDYYPIGFMYTYNNIMYFYICLVVWFGARRSYVTRFDEAWLTDIILFRG